MALSKIQDEMLALSGNACKAWVHFNGVGTVTITDSFNVSSITDNGTGNYTVNLTNPMNDVNYSVAVSSYAFVIRDNAAHTTSTVTVATYSSGFALTDYSRNSVVIFGN